jgi:amino acid permease
MTLLFAAARRACAFGCAACVAGAGDMAMPVVNHICAGPDAGSACSTLGNRAAITILATVAVMPLALCHRIHNLAAGSAVAIGTLLGVAGIVVGRGMQAAAGSHAAVAAANPAMVAVIAMPICIFALGNHIQAVPIALSAPVDTFPYVVLTSSVTAATLYLATGISGYLMFGAATSGDILNSFAAEDAAANVARTLMAIHVTLALPVIMLPCRTASLALGRWCWQAAFPSARRASYSTAAAPPAQGADKGHGHEAPLLAGHQHGGGVTVATDGVEGLSFAGVGAMSPATAEAEALLRTTEEVASSQEHVRTVLGMGCSVSQVATTVCAMAAAATLAIALPSISTVFGLLGATVAVLQIYGFPGLALLRRAKLMEAGQYDLPNAPSLVTWGILPSTPAALRLHGRFLLVVSVVVAVVGTGSSIAGLVS